MKPCSNCQSETNPFPLYPELFTGLEGWCFKCIHEEVEFRYKKLQDEGFFRKQAEFLNKEGR